MPSNIAKKPLLTFTNVFNVMCVTGAMIMLLNLLGWLPVRLDSWYFMVFTMTLIYLVEYLPQVFKKTSTLLKRATEGGLMVVALASQIYLFFEIPRLDWAYGSDWTNGDIIFGTFAIF